MFVVFEAGRVHFAVATVSAIAAAVFAALNGYNVALLAGISFVLTLILTIGLGNLVCHVINIVAHLFALAFVIGIVAGIVYAVF